MRLALMVALPIAVGSCGSSWQQDCNEVFNSVCAHQIECEMQYDYASCEADVKGSFYCDESATSAELKACADLAETASCTEFMPEQCYVVLCSTVAGCVEGTPGGHSETLLPPGGSGPPQ